MRVAKPLQVILLEEADRVASQPVKGVPIPSTVEPEADVERQLQHVRIEGLHCRDVSHLVGEMVEFLDPKPTARPLGLPLSVVMEPVAPGIVEVPGVEGLRRHALPGPPSSVRPANPAGRGVLDGFQVLVLSDREGGMGMVLKRRQAVRLAGQHRRELLGLGQADELAILGAQPGAAAVRILVDQRHPQEVAVEREDNAQIGTIDPEMAQAWSLM